MIIYSNLLYSISSPNFLEEIVVLDAPPHFVSNTLEDDRTGKQRKRTISAFSSNRISLDSSNVGNSNVLYPSLSTFLCNMHPLVRIEPTAPNPCTNVI